MFSYGLFGAQSTNQAEHPVDVRDVDAGDRNVGGRHDLHERAEGKGEGAAGRQAVARLHAVVHVEADKVRRTCHTVLPTSVLPDSADIRQRADFEVGARLKIGWSEARAWFCNGSVKQHCNRGHF